MANPIDSPAYWTWAGVEGSVADSVSATKKFGEVALLKLAECEDIKPIAALARELMAKPGQAALWLVQPDYTQPDMRSPLSRIRAGGDDRQAVVNLLTYNKALRMMGP
jgi:hypothetical protein